MERKIAQSSFTDLTLADIGSANAKAFFDKCEQHIPFAQLAAAVANIFVESRPDGGAPHWPVVLMLKILFVQKCWGLSDPQAQEMLLDRISFRRFIGLSFDDKTPDQSTIWLFRQRLEKAGHAATLFEKSLEILQERGLIVQTGTLVDATIIEAPLGRKRPEGTSTADPCASKSVKSGRTYHGYRGHVAGDRNGVITDFVFDSARVSEHVHFDHLVEHEKRAVYADSGCRSKARVTRLRERGVLAAVAHRRVKGQAELMPWQKRYNYLVSRTRAMIEHPFGAIKRMLGPGTQARYRTMRRNALDFGLSVIVWNWRRTMSLPLGA